MVKGMDRWLQEYERFRTSPYEPNQSWTSSKFDIEGMRWIEITELYIPELEMTFGQACSALRKSWYRYRMDKREGINPRDIALRIKRIQRALGIEEYDFPELDREWADDQLSMEDMELMKEEAEENDDWNIEQGAEDAEEEEEDEEDDDTWWEGV